MKKLLGWLLGAGLILILWPTGFVEGAPVQGAALAQPGATQGNHSSSQRPFQPMESRWAESTESQRVPKLQLNPIHHPCQRKPKRVRRQRKKGRPMAYRHHEASPSVPEEPSQTLMKKVGSAPILHHFIQRMGVVSIIDSLVPSHPDRKISHGEAVAGLMAYLLNGGRALYRVEKWAEETSILSQIFSGYRPQDWTDDRLADTLDALYRKGLELVQGSISAHIVGEFGLQLDEIHYDPTSVSLWGTYDSSTGEPAVLITQGYSKDHRSDLKQVVVGMAVTGDGKVPLVSGTHDGNTAECTMPLPYWERLRQLAAKSSFCFIGDCKIATQETLQELCIQDGEFLAPLPMSVSQKQELVKTLKEDNLVFTPITPEEEGQKPIYKRRTSQPGTRRKRELQPLQAVEEREEWEGGKVSEESPGKVSPPYEVCEAPWIIEDKQGRRYTLRKLIFRSAQLTRQHADTRERHLEKAEAELRALGKKLNKRKLKTREAIEAVAAAIIKAHKVEGMIGFHIQEQINLLRKKLGRGKPGPKSRYQIEEEVTYRLWVQRHPEVIRQKALLDGIFLMVSNRDPQQWPASRLLGLYKRQYKVEQVIHVLKGPLAVVPMLLEKPERICSMIFILTLALQLYTLIQRQTAQELLRRGYPLEGLMPNKIQTWRPQTNTLLAAFDNINWVEIIREGYSPLRSVTSLNPLQLKILGLLGVPVKDYSIEALIPKSGET